MPVGVVATHLFSESEVCRESPSVAVKFEIVGLDADRNHGAGFFQYKFSAVLQGGYNSHFPVGQTNRFYACYSCDSFNVG